MVTGDAHLLQELWHLMTDNYGLLRQLWRGAGHQRLSPVLLGRCLACC